MKYFILLLAWSLYLALHSILASDQAKGFATQKLRFSAQAYRLLYSMISIAGLVGLLVLMAVLKSNYLFVSGQALQYVAMILASWGVIIIIVSFRQMSGLAFLGLKKEEDTGLVTTGIHGWIRHPIYSGTILIFIGMFLYTPTDVVLVTVLVNFIYIPIGIYLEEKKLIRHFGDEYVAYRRNVKALVPWVV